MTDTKIARYKFAVKVDDNLTCLIDADRALLVGEAVHFIVDINERPAVVSVFNKFEHYLIESMNDKPNNLSDEVLTERVKTNSRW